MGWEKCGSFTDIHFGRKNDSEQHNRDCLDFITWFCDIARDERIDQVNILGDWHDNRSRLRLDTIWSSRSAMDTLVKLGIPIIKMIGNHDMYMKSSRDIHSHPYTHLYPNVRVINQITKIDDSVYCPYLVGSEYADLPGIECKYMWGHFELTSFMTNEWYEWDSKGVGLHPDMLVHPEWVFSGHFHKRQIKPNRHDVNICYIGNAFPMDYNDLHDRDRGGMFLEYGGTPVFKNWDNAPSYNRTTMSKIVDLIDAEEFEQTYNTKSVIECINDVNIPDEDLFELNAYIQSLVRTFSVKPQKAKLEDLQVEVEMNEDLDQLVLGTIEKLDVKGTRIDLGLQRSIYEGVMKGL